MTWKVPDGFERRLSDRGFTLADAAVDGPMGSARYLFTDGTVDVAVFNDRDEIGIGLGVCGSATFELWVWLCVLGLISPIPTDDDARLTWILDNTAKLHLAVEGDDEIDRRLRDVNFAAVKEKLGLSPRGPGVVPT